MEQSVNYSEIHAFMLKKTQEYYQNPPRVLVEAVISDYQSRGEEVTWNEAKKLVSLIDIQRYIKQEMKARWPQFMASIPENGLRDR